MRIRKISPETTYKRNRTAILAAFEDYGYGLSPEKAFVDQIDRMMTPGDNPYTTIYRFVQGGGILVYNDDVKEYMEKKLGIPCGDDPDCFERYCRFMASDGNRLYNEIKSGATEPKKKASKPKTKPPAKPKTPVKGKTMSKSKAKKPAKKTATKGRKS